MSPQLSLVVLGFGEGPHLRPFIQNAASLLNKSGLDWEIVLVANYRHPGNDSTPNEARQLARSHPRVRAVAGPQPKNAGMGWDAAAGLSQARGQTLALIDGDGQVSIQDVITGYHILRTRRLGLLIGKRAQRESWWRRRLSQAYNGIFQMAFPSVGLSDINAKPKLIRRTAYQALGPLDTGWAFDLDMVLKAWRRGLACDNFPVRFTPLRHRNTHVGLGAIFEIASRLVLEWRLQAQNPMDRADRNPGPPAPGNKMDPPSKRARNNAMPSFG